MLFCYSRAMHTTLITGVNGFVGQHLARAMKKAGCQVWGVGQDATANPEVKQYLDHYLQCDLTDAKAVAELPLNETDSIINLAGLANVGASFGQAELYQKVNVDILANIGARLHPGKTRLIAISTGGVYDPFELQPATEASKIVEASSTSPYVASKLAMEQIAYGLRAMGVNCVIARPFNHLGPGQLPGFLIPDLTEQLVQAQRQNKTTIMVGNLNTKRDYSDVRDVVSAYYSLATAKELKHPVYNVCSGKPLSGLQILDYIKAELDIENLDVTVDPKRVRASDPAELSGDHSALSQDTCWQPMIPIGQTIHDFVSWYKTS